MVKMSAPSNDESVISYVVNAARRCYTPESDQKVIAEQHLRGYLQSDHLALRGSRSTEVAFPPNGHATRCFDGCPIARIIVTLEVKVKSNQNG